jgi:hypothetical protein
VTIACSTLNRLARSLGASSLPRVVRAGVIIPSGVGLDGLPVHSSCDAHNLGQTPHRTAPAMARASPPSSRRRSGGERVHRQQVVAAAKGTQSALSEVDRHGSRMLADQKRYIVCRASYGMMPSLCASRKTCGRGREEDGEGAL